MAARRAASGQECVRSFWMVLVLVLVPVVLLLLLLLLLPYIRHHHRRGVAIVDIMVYDRLRTHI